MRIGEVLTIAEYIDLEAARREIEQRERLMVGDKTISVDALKRFLLNRPAADVAPVFVCECCGQRFYNKQEYNTHKNFYDGRHWYGPKAERDILRDMFMCGYDLRNKSTIEKRLRCFTSWENIDDGRKSRIKNKANSLLVRMDKAEKYAEKIVSRSTPMERYFLLLELKSPLNDTNGILDHLI